ncbi:MAG: SMP-30/gluconolactonase/LRE family protein [Leptolyngbya sp. SIO4C1]|nr:SMP-30/gluconolactonase/LRE family protein [Leptolyngbya sp. SIO4C1]
MAIAEYPLHNLLPARARLGEGPIWDDVNQLLYWVDIYNYRVHRFDPATRENTHFDVGDTVGAIALTHTNQILLAQRHWLSFLDLETREVTRITAIEEDLAPNRLNDGKCDAAGRFWFGSMSANKEAASLYCYTPSGHLKQIETGLTISNGLGWSPDNQTFYLTDSPTGHIYAYDFDLESGQIEHQRVLINLSEEDFSPDGLTVDQEGCLWSVMWDGWCVVRFDPDGQEMGRIQLPVQRPTCCTFGGEEMMQLFVTSASVGLSEEEIQKSFFSGDLFGLETDVVGLPSRRFGDDETAKKLTVN